MLERQINRERKYQKMKERKGNVRKRKEKEK